MPMHAGRCYAGLASAPADVLGAVVLRGGAAASQHKVRPCHTALHIDVSTWLLPACCAGSQHIAATAAAAAAITAAAATAVAAAVAAAAAAAAAASVVTVLLQAGLATSLASAVMCMPAFDPWQMPLAWCDTLFDARL